MPSPEKPNIHLEQSPQNGYYDPPIRYIVSPKTYVHESDATRFHGAVDIDASKGEIVGMPFDDETRIRYENQGIGEYPDPERITKVEQLLKEKKHLKYGRVFLQGGQGSDGILEHIVQGFITEDTAVIATGPHFPRIAFTVMQRGDEDTYLSVQPPSFKVTDGVSLLLQEPELLNGDRKLIYISNPNSPLGDTVSIEKLRELADLAQQKNHILLVDEAFGDVLEDEESAIQLTDEFPSVIVTRSFSKFYGMPGSGIGITYMSENLGNEYEKLLAPYRIRGIELEIAEKMAMTDLTEFTTKKKKQITQRKVELLDALEDAGIAYLPTDRRTPILTIISGDDFQQEQLERIFNIKTASAEAFEETHSKMTKRYFRVTVRDSFQDHQQLVFALSLLRDRNSQS